MVGVLVCDEAMGDALEEAVTVGWQVDYGVFSWFEAEEGKGRRHTLFAEHGVDQNFMVCRFQNHSGIAELVDFHVISFCAKLNCSFFNFIDSDQEILFLIRLKVSGVTPR